MSRGWIGVDLDGTLAHYYGWKGITHIGPPVPMMLERVKSWIEDGKTVKIFTARASNTLAIPYIRLWMEQNGLPDLEITATKDFGMVELWDDRCVQVVANMGEVATEQDSEMIKAEYEKQRNSAKSFNQIDDFEDNSSLDQSEGELQTNAQRDGNELLDERSLSFARENIKARKES